MERKVKPTFSDWTALTAKEWRLPEGKTLRGEAERPLGATKALEIGEVKLDFSWLAIGEAAAMASLTEENGKEWQRVSERERVRSSQILEGPCVVQNVKKAVVAKARIISLDDTSHTTLSLIHYFLLFGNELGRVVPVFFFKEIM